MVEAQNTAMVSSVRQVNERITNLAIPTKVSELENDSGYLTEHQSLENYITEEHYADGMASQNTATNALIRQVNERIDGITVPTKVSELENDSGYLTEHQSLADYSTTTEVQAMIDASAGEGGKDEVYVGTTAPTDTNIKLWVDTSASGSSTPSGGGSSTVQGYAFTSGKTLTDEDKAHILEIQSNPLIPMYINGNLVSKIYSGGNYIQFRVIEIKGVGNDCFSVYSVNYNQSGITSNELNLQMQWYIASSNGTIDGELITSYNLKDQIKQNAGWSYTTNSSESDLYNAKEMVLIGTNAMNENFQKYYNFSYESNQNEACLGSDYQNITYTITVSNSNNITWYYNGSSIDTSAVIQLILYKT